MKTIERMIKEHGGLAAVQANYLSIENPPYMRLVVEIVGTIFPNGICEVSVAHYGTQNGDAMKDPEVTFFVTPQPDGAWQWHPLTFTNDYVNVYQVAAEYDNFGQLRVRNAKLVLDLTGFTEMWDRNLKEQGFLEAFRQQHARTFNGEQIGATHATP